MNTDTEPKASASQNRVAEVGEAVLKTALREEMYGKPTSQAQHSRLPWINNGGRIESENEMEKTLGTHVVATVGIVNKQSRQNTANARLIVASVNNAEAMAEALRKIQQVHASTDTAYAIAEKALAQWEKASQ